MMKNKYTQYRYCLSFMLLVFFLGACTKMNDTYHDFWDAGEHIYPASPDSLTAFSGRNRIQLQWLNIGDPTLQKAVIYWNNHSDSLTVPIEKKETSGADTMKVLIDPLSEGAYSFDIFTYDKNGNRSVVANAIGKAYGNTYAASLLTRLVQNNSFLDDTLRIQWGDPADATAIGTEIVYTDTNGRKPHRMVASEADTTIIADYDKASKYFKYRTLFLPDSTAIDTFYTAYDSIRVLGPRTDLSKTGWTVEASSYDNRNGRTDRFPEKAIDENTATNWVNLVGSTDFPHELIIDMGAVQQDIYGVSLFASGGAENPATMNVYTSDDHVNWQPFGLKSIEKLKNTWQYFDFPEAQQFRYLKLVFETSYGSANIILYEAGVYTR